MRSWTSPGLVSPPSPRNWCHGARGSRTGGRPRGHSQPLEVLQVLENSGLQLGDLVVAEEPGNQQRRKMIWYRRQVTQLLLKLPRSLRAPRCQHPRLLSLSSSNAGLWIRQANVGGEGTDAWDVPVPLPCPTFSHLLQFKAGLVQILAGARSPRGPGAAALRAWRAKRSAGRPPSHRSLPRAS